MDALPPTSAVQVMVREMAACGLDKEHVSVTWERDLQGYQIVVREKARASSAQLECIHKAAGSEIVTFEEPALQAAFDDYRLELYRPRMIADAKARIAQLGLIDGFPRKAAFHELGDYAAALERHSGLCGGSTLRVSGDTVFFDPPRGSGVDAQFSRYEKILAAVMYASAIGDLKHFGFIGNEAVSPIE